MNPNDSKNTAENKSLDELDISSFSSATGINKKDEEIQKLKAELQQIKETKSNQFGEHSMMQMGWQFGEKFGKMEKEIDGLKSANRVEIQAFEELKSQMVKMTEAFEGLKAAENEEKSAFKELKEEFEKMSGENAGLKKKMAKMNEEFAGMTAEFEGQIAKKNGEMGKMKAEMQHFFVKHNELKGKIAQLVKLTDKYEGLEKEDEMTAGNLTEGIDGMEFTQMKNNKWNAADCGPKLVISGEGGLVVKHLGGQGWNCVRAISPISPFDLNVSKPSIARYFEAQIGSMNPRWISFPNPPFRFDTTIIGFCSGQFPLEDKWLGEVENSIGIHRKDGMHINGQFKKFGNGGGYFKFFKVGDGDFKFKVGDVVGAGVIHSPANKFMKCFGTWNGQLLGTLELPDNFSTLQFFPAVGLFDAGDSIRANFGQQKWRYDPSQLLK